MKILVALSGGVDSSTAAGILKQSGYAVAGAIMVFKGVTEEDIDYARRAAAILDIDFFQLDFSDYYYKNIVENFINEYQSGRTPNPCVLCNQLIKFGLFLKQAKKIGFDRVATGHYARLEKIGNQYLLKRGKDKNEQSYFLYRLSQSQLQSIILPLGNYTKDEIRKRAKKMNLPTAQRKKSQDVCFLPAMDYAFYLQKILPEKKGPFYDLSGSQIGEHKGIYHYTVGQRKGIGISSKEPYYVVKIDAANNAVYLGRKSDVYKKELIAKNINFTFKFDFNQPLNILAKPRYFTPLARATIFPEKNRIRVRFEKPQWALTPGQSVVFYENDIVLGGGIIEEVLF